MKPFSLPDSLLFGTATASLQIEGGDQNNSWYRWAQTGHVKDGMSCLVADDHWNRIPEDIDLMSQLHQQTYRMSIEWSRIEPNEGHFDPEAMEHYRSEIAALTEAGIRPLVTLHHFSNPLWLEDRGGWLNPSVVDSFERYAEYVVRSLADLVSDWCTINEPNVYLLNGYLGGGWPPNERSLAGYLRGARNMILAHARVYRRIHTLRSLRGYQDTMVGTALHFSLFDPEHGTRCERWEAAVCQQLFQDIFVTGTCEGRLVPPLGAGYPLGKGRTSDFLGINYYRRQIVSGLRIQEGDEGEKNDLGWEIYPKGLYRICRRYWDLCHLPIFITENGIADKADTRRSRFLYDHLAQVHRLIDEGVDIRRYYYWSLLDNFEWLEGMTAHFGLVAVDAQTLERTIRTSGWFYADIIQNHGVSEKMLRQYLD